MSKRKTSRARRAGKPRPQVLQLRVRSVRIMWFETADWLKKLFKLVLIGGVVAGLVWAIGIGLRRAFLENEDFRISLIELNDNPVMDELRLVEMGGIDLNESIFSINVSELEGMLLGLPELAVADVERELPGTLRVRVQARVPVAWLEVPVHEVRGRDPESGLLVDPNGILFPCLGEMAGSTIELPVIVIKDPRQPEPLAGALCESPELLRGLAMLRLAKKVDGMPELGITRIEQSNEWSVVVETGDGIEAKFGLSGHDRQFDDLVRAHRHAESQGYRIATIDLIPERNIPITTLGSAPPPRAIPVAEPDARPPAPPSRREQDMKALLNRG